MSSTIAAPATERVVHPLDPADASPAVRSAVHAWLALQHLAAYEPARARRALGAAADPAAALRTLFGVGPHEVLDARALASLCALLAGAGARLVPFGSALYPARVAALEDAPPLLVVRGAAGVLARPAVAIVGARVATRRGQEFAFALARDLAACGVLVVSGLARGIDAAAHRGALAAHAPTAAVLGCGPELVYPPEHAALAREIAACGAVLSELPPGAPPAKHHFPLRNRLISALARAVVVVEARARSGSLVTARHAADQGRDVMAVPGAVGDPTSEGPNQLLRAGAWPVLDASDVLAAIGLGPASAVERASRAPSPKPGGPSVPPVAARHATHPVVRALAHEPRARDELAAALGWPASRLARELALLELDGAIVEERDGRLHVVVAHEAHRS